MKVAFYLLLLVHALIHLLGFIQGFQLRQLSALSQPITKLTGFFWGLTFVIFVAYGISHLRGSAYSWLFGLLGVLLSQALIIGAWSDAKYGTLVNIAILLVALAGAGQYFFDKRWEATVATVLTPPQPPAASAIQEVDMAGLPGPVQQWLKRSGALGRPGISHGRLTQSLRLKMKPEQEESYQAQAVQYTNLRRPAFAWKVEVPANALMRFSGQDRFTDGKGEMYIALHGLIPVVLARGPKIDEGSAQRYLGEIVWFPGAALSPYLSWEAIDAASARATLNYRGITASGTFYFSSDGDLLRFEALRYKENKRDARRYPWILEVQGYDTFEGIRVPSQMTATWQLEDGDWTWLELKLLSLQAEDSFPEAPQF